MTPIRRYGAETPVVNEKPLRADARRNRARVLAAAEDVFAEHGVGASTEEVARRAGVGIGTVFRHFPTKEALLEAVLVERMRRLAEIARERADEGAPEEAFFGFLELVVGQSATKNALAGAVAEVESVVAEVGRELRAAIEVLLVRAQEAGVVRGDVSAGDVIAVLVGASRAVEYAGAGSRAARVIFDGLRPGVAREIGGQAPGEWG
ncbi:TetR/AcrR family transcriptional regulator [Dactylosporangium sucinum]|uniref:TetR family transcriptional regulator n=1 Tax=Dactylosporangium sucinum TaxID=1424081 RepID=A0A917T4G3_9ACTN|nr:TetR/AcrR family transcriptional regulator [Dactylosporangium sucinum]GGM08815.1 TetR family transcriptional regulator [Dactylosporangium sucinum]